MGDLVPTSSITSVRFSIAGDEANLADSSVRVLSYDLFQASAPHPDGVYGTRLGTTDYAHPCATCLNSKRACLGHSGHYELNYPIWSPMTFNDLNKWLKIICFNCGNPIIDQTLYLRFPKAKRLEEASKIARTPIRECVH